jgi:lipoate-protein ligase A
MLAKWLLDTNPKSGIRLPDSAGFASSKRPMRLLNFTSEDPVLDLALEEALHLSVEAGRSPPTWRVWEATSPAIVLGTGQEVAKEVRLEHADADGIPVLRRHSGGGCVLIGPGVLQYSGFYPFERLADSSTINGAMASALRPVQQALQALGVATSLAGYADVVTPYAPDGGVLRKLAGNAQARKRTSLVVHGTLLAKPDWRALERYLAFPSRVPDYRAGRGHRDFLVSLEELGAPTDRETFAAALHVALALTVTADDLELASAPTAAEWEEAQRLRKEKYTQAAWNRRR